MDDGDLQGENGIVSAYRHGSEQGGKAGADISAQSECIKRYCQKLCIGDRRILAKLTG